MSGQPTVVWFRRDLRLSDNRALSAAVRKGGPVIPVYLADWEHGEPWAPGEAARWWLGRSLARLAKDLARRDMALRVVRGEPVSALTELTKTIGAGEVVWNRLYEPWCRELDRRMEASLRHAGVASRHLAGALLFDPEEHLSQTGRPFVQFGAFWRNCQTLPGPAEPESRPARITGAPPGVVVEALGITMTSARPSGGESEDLPESAGWTPRAVGPAGPWEPGEDGARTRLEGFLERALATYETSRDFPGIEGVSRLSPHLHFGEISPHQVWHTVRDACRSRGRALETGSEAPGAGGGEAFLRQLGWREFAHYLLFHFPAMPVEPFHPEFAAFPWADDPDGLAAWQQGATGYPLIDAGMRQLLAEGWMHNRVRMVVASFLTKDLMIPWQRGAAWFWDRLVDADLANNTLGWQWTAGSGPDAAPYFRVFNPALQARRFDGDSAYVRRWIPEAIADADEERGYPAPIVDHASARLRALAAFRELRRR